MIITEAINSDGRYITVSDALKIRESLKAKSENHFQLYFHPLTEEEVLPVKSHKTRLSNAKAHFRLATKPEIYSGNFKDSKSALEQMISILSRSGCHSFDIGKIFVDDQTMDIYRGWQQEIDYGFPVMYTIGQDGNEYGILMLSRVPNSDEFLTMLKDVNDNRRIENEPRFKIRIKTPQNEYDVNKISLLPVLLKNHHIYRTNPEHEQTHLRLGDWMNKHLLPLLSNQNLTYFNPETNGLELAELVQHPHECQYTVNRHLYRRSSSPLIGSDVCRQIILTSIEVANLEFYELPKNQIIRNIGPHPRLHLAKFVLGYQKSLF